MVPTMLTAQYVKLDKIKLQNTKMQKEVEWSLVVCYL